MLKVIGQWRYREANPHAQLTLRVNQWSGIRWPWERRREARAFEAARCTLEIAGG